ncbi:uncharacterized protein G2W53_028298 [Senna tora]|uniref:Uncharacterized protein n=1 Tax=Senna tora TaxID=362788 RepID=A0A834T229_9FABA|nr:uncharacterized protein G2W53_028298 [Senna tora]
MRKDKAKESIDSRITCFQDNRNDSRKGRGRRRTTMATISRTTTICVEHTISRLSSDADNDFCVGSCTIAETTVDFCIVRRWWRHCCKVEGDEIIELREESLYGSGRR